MITVDIPSVGSVDFPDGMSPQDISAHSARLHSQAVLSKPSMVMGPDGQWGQLAPDSYDKPMTPGLFTVPDKAPSSTGQMLLNPPVQYNEPKTFDTGVLGGLEGAGNALGKVATASTTPALAALPAVGKIPGVGPAALSTIGMLFGVDMLKQTQDDLSKGVTAKKLGEAAVNLPLSVLLMGHGVKGLTESVGLGVDPTALSKDYKFPPVKVEDYPDKNTGLPQVGANRQLTDSPYVVAPGGKTVQSASLSPREMTEFQREAQARALHQGGTAQEAMVKASLGQLDKPAVSSPEQINELLGVGRKYPVMGIRQSPNYEANQEMPFNEVFNNLTRKEGIGNFFVRIGNDVHPFNSIQEAEDSFGAARKISNLSPQEIAKKGPFEVYNAAKQHIGNIDSEGKFSLKGFQSPEEPPSTAGPLVPKGPGPKPPSPVQLLDKPQVPKALLPPGDTTSETPGRNPVTPVSGEQPPVALSFQELGKKVDRTPEEEARFQELKAKSDEANKKMAGDWASQLKAKTPVKTGAPTRTLMDAEAATLRHDYLPWLTPEQRSGLVKEYTEGGDIKAIEQKAQALRKQVIQDRITTEKQTNENKTKEKGSNVKAPGILPKQGLQQQGSGGAREGSGGGARSSQENQANPQDEVKPKEEVLSPKAQEVWNKAKVTKDEFTGVDASGLSKEERQVLARKGLSFSEDRNQKAVATYPQRLRVEDLRQKVAGKGIGKGINKALNKNKTDESGMIDLRGVVDTAVQAKKKLAASLATRDNKKDIVREKDVADNAATIVGQRARTGQESLAKVLFGSRSKEALNATTAAIEAKGDVKKLDDFIRIAKAKNDQSGLNAATFAKANWDKIQPLVKRAEAQHNMVFNAAKSEGVNVDYRTGYIRHLYDLSKLPQHYADLFFGESGGSGGKGFKKERTFDTLYDAIDAGYGKAIKSWNSAELLEHRLRRGFQEVNDLQWAKHFASVKDPTTGSPVVSLTERPGYERWSSLGQTFYIHRGYGKVFEAAQGMSAIRKFEAGGLPIGDIMMKGLGTAKHSLLMFDSYHAIRMAAKSLSLTGGVGHRAGLALLEYNPGDLKAAVAAGDITLEMADWANKNRATANLGIKNGLNIGRVQEAIDSDIVRKLNVLGTGTANKWIFEKFTRGVMLETFVSEFDRVKKANPGMTDDSVAKKVARDLNFNFGNIGRQGILRSATAQDMARMVFLAPQWFESMAQTEARSVGQIAKVPVTGKVGTLAKGTGTLLLAMFVATQVANMASKGHPTWDNPEGHKMDAWIPGTGAAKDGLYVSPFSLPMELTHDIIRYSNQGKSPLEVADKIVGNKLSPPMRAGHTLYEREDYAGRKLTDKQALIQAGKDALPLPLLGQAYLNPSASFERQAMASAGLKAEPAESPRQRLQQLARKVSPSSVVYPVSQYAPLKNLIENGKIDEAKTEYQKLIKGKTEKEVQNVENYFKELPNQIHTGSQEKEQKFYDGLSPEDKKLYQEVRKENKDLSDKFFNEVIGHSPKMSRTKRKRFSAFTYENDN